MIRDPFYRKIIEGLHARLDPELFEQCAADLLRAIYPTLVPIPGGKDAGMDGAIADGEGEPFPLICTTSENVIGNLTRSLTSYVKEGGTRRKAIFATSQKLTPRRIRNLCNRAQEHGFVLLHVYTQEAMADLLYRSPEWCRELLGLVGDPAPLSVIPLTVRPLLDQELVGRDADLDWVRNIDDDRLLVGQPGSGKTFLLYKLAREGNGLFVVSDDRGAIAEGIRAQEPQTLIVDDAQTKTELLLDLEQMRHAMGAQYSILASCWPGDEGQVAETLGLPESEIRRLEPLTRDEIVEVTKSAGMGGPDRLIREIVDQAEGWPGMAVTLAQLCLQGDVRAVASGDAIARSWSRLFDGIAGGRTKEILAALAVGGRAGMPMAQVAEVLDLSLIDVRHVAEQLAAGGVIYDVGQGCLSVRPEALRDVLVRDVFCSGSISLPIEPLVQVAPSLEDVTMTLIGAKARGGDVSPGLLASIVQRSGSMRAWRKLAWLGPAEALLALEMHRDRAVDLAQPALHQVPETIIPLLLSQAIGDDRLLGATPEHPLRLIEDWIHGAEPATGQAFERRAILARCVRAWLANGGAQRIGLRALESVFAPETQYVTSDPGSGMTMTVHYACLTMEELIAVQGLWPDTLTILKEHHIEDWQPVRAIVEKWAYPGRMFGSMPSEVYNAMQAFACQMLQDIVAIASDRASVLHWAAELSRQRDLDIDVPLDPVFETLFPPEDLKNWRSGEREQLEAIRELAATWSEQDPECVAVQIASAERESRCAGRIWPRWTPQLCREIAQKTESPNAWSRAMIEASAEPDVVEPFLRRAAEIDEPGWIDHAIRCLKEPALRWAAVFVTLTLPKPPEELLTLVIQHLDGYAQTVNVACLRGQVSEQVVRQLLVHKDPAIRSATALGEWNADPEHSVRADLEPEWRAAMSTCTERDYLLADILQESPLLAHDWLQNLITQDWGIFFGLGRAIEAATSALDIDGKRRILHRMHDSHTMARVVFHLVGGDLQAYRELLSIDELRSLHLTPLAGDLGGAWEEKAKLALDAGYQPAEIAGSVYGYPLSIAMYSGNESARWAEWVDRWSRLLDHQDERLRRVAEIGRSQAQRSMEAALREERQEAVYGFE